MILGLKFEGKQIQVKLSDGRILSLPLVWYPKLATASKRQLENFKISPAGYGIHWPELDEDLSVHGFLFPNK
ncbi:MAG: DUF2442 domain-containing protein [Elusimicrobia bacterium CG_4_10_14_0_8_um_filter_37_32]|nr:MAG: DUF2442 domain-containing protein [Elusimicrobia bacterium CG02_land_8_20_14_3_00_37_13]PIZ12566.1 MAG: DUF2442 domain-containing protein [Elusimicrobia bacterium CG_4_10_14_0_8_um_filter_37_32]